MLKKNKESKGTSKLLIVFVGILFLIIVFMGAFFAFYTVNSKKQGIETKEEVIKTTNISLGDDFVVNLAEVGKNRYIKTNITVAYNNKDKNLAESVANNIPVLRDATIIYLKSLNEEELNDVNEIKKGIIKALNDSVKSESFIVDVYFQSFLIQ